MRSVQRSDMPDSLVQNANRWRSHLLREIRACRDTRRKVPASYFDKYKQPDVREALRKMYGGLCCYCEGRIKDVSFDHIEHRKPKSKYPGDTFRWDNLHLACQQCNTAKGNKWSGAAPILDAVLDSPLADHLTYRESATGLRRWPKSDRGNTTVEHADLDRDGWDGLPGTRARVLLETMRVIREIKENPEAPASQAVKRELLDKAGMEYGTVIAWAVEKWG
jgi:5-methylcytosine-specific restriction endonuclease McrA